MTQEEKELLIKDLSARLSYGVKLKIGEHSDYKLIGIVIIDEHPIKVEVIENEIPYKIEVSPDIIKPYLRSITSMTKKEREEFNHIRDIVAAKFINAVSKDGFTLAYYDLIDWLNAHHFDYRGLIGAGLAIEAPKGIYK